MTLKLEDLNQTLTIKTVQEEGGIGVFTTVEPGFGSADEDDEYIAKTLVSVLWSVFPDALAPAFIEHLDQVSKQAE